MSVQEELHATLSTMMRVIGSGGGAGDPSLPELIQRLDQFEARLPDEAPPMLRHYLEKRSYAKALDLLEGRDEASAPNC